MNSRNTHESGRKNNWGWIVYLFNALSERAFLIKEMLVLQHDAWYEKIGNFIAEYHIIKK